MSVTILVGDVLEQLATLADESVDCVVTSPPYWGLRDYEVEGQIGLEPTLGEHLDVMVRVFEEVRRVLKPTGTLWLNYGDCYATAPNGRSAAATKAAGGDDRTFRDKPFSTSGPIYCADYEKTDRSGRGQNKGNLAGSHGGRVMAGGYLKPKDLCMIPNRLAIALQDAGWWVRSEIIWGKPNPMPDSSGAQRPSTAHEKIFLLAKSDDGDVWRARDTGELSFSPDLTERCALITDETREGPRWMRIGSYYDAEAVRMGDGDHDVRGRETYGRHTLSDALPAGERRPAIQHSMAGGGRGASTGKRVKMPDGWDTAPGGHGSRHRAGREKGKVRALTPRHEGHINHTGIENTPRGSRYLRNYEPAGQLEVWEMAIEPFKGAHFATFPTELARRAILAGCPRGGTVLDIFGGAGTVGLVADRLQRNAILIELNPAYAEIARARIAAPRGPLLDAMESAA